MFADNGVTFYIGRGPERVKFDKPGACEHSVHVSGMKAHAHTHKDVRLRSEGRPRPPPHPPIVPKPAVDRDFAILLDEWLLVPGSPER
jgi:hypothetical protein